MTKVLITGASGFIGHHVLSHALKTTDWEIVCLESFRHRGISSRLQEVLEDNKDHRNRVSVIHHDLQAPIDHILAKKLGDINLIINIASESHVDRSLETPRPFIENNIMLILTVLEYARTLKNLELFIQVSTDEVYGPVINGNLHKEYDTLLPSNPYSASKAAQESIAISYWRSYDIPVVITNTMNNLGERQDPEKFVPKILKTLLNNKKMPVHAQNINNNWVAGSRFYLHALNNADALIYITKNINKFKYKRSEGLDRPLKFHIPGNKKVANDEMVILISKLMGLQENIFEYKNSEQFRPGHDLEYGLDPGTLAQWGWIPPISFEEGLKRTVEWFLNNRHWLD